MKFKVSRTSGSCIDEDKPCEGVTLEKYTYIEVRTLNSIEEFDKRFEESEGKWLSKGINHCINEQGYVQREFPNDSEGWFIEINSLDDLIKFNKQHGDIILRKCWDNKNISEIEIYDDYRE